MSKIRTLKISVRSAGGTTVIDIEGSITIGTSRDLRSSLFETLEKTPRVALNMAGIGYIDSSGIATLVEVLKKARDLEKDFLMFGVTGTVHAVLTMTKLVGVFRIFDNEEHALQDR